MPGYLDPPSNITWGYADGEDGWGTAVNRALRQLAYIGANRAIKNMTTSTPPSSPANGDKYIVAASPTGAWSTYNAGDLAIWGRGISTATLSWQRMIPYEGAQVYDESTNSTMTFNGSNWEVSNGVQSDFAETDSTDPAFIKNKPVIEKADWTETDPTNAGFIENVPANLRTFDPSTVGGGGEIVREGSLTTTFTISGTAGTTSSVHSFSLTAEQQRWLLLGKQPVALAVIRTLRSVSAFNLTLTINAGGVRRSSYAYRDPPSSGSYYIVTRYLQPAFSNGSTSRVGNTGTISLIGSRRSGTGSHSIYVQGTVYWGVR